MNARALTIRSVLLSVALIFLTNVWMMHTELVTGRYVTAGIPPIPAVGALLILVVLNPALRRVRPRWALNRGEILVVYVSLTVGVAITATYGVRSFFPYLTAVRYFATPENKFDTLVEKLPSWLIPTDPDTLRKNYEGAETEPVPWGVWLPHLALWAGFFLVLFLTIYCLLSLIRRHWTEDERLTFPLVYLPLHVTEPSAKGELGASLFLNAWTWVGIGVAFLFNLLNILQAFNPAMPAINLTFPVAPFFTERPFTPLGTMMLFIRPELIGFAYLVPSEVLFSVWFFYFINRFIAVMGLALGYEIAGFPFSQEQSGGGYVAMAVFLMWAARGQLKKVWGYGSMGVRGKSDSHTPTRPYAHTLTFFGLIAGVVLLTAFFHAIGLPWTVAALYLFVLLCFVLTYARIRAEAGLALEFVYPYGYPKTLILNALGTQNILAMGGVQAMAAFATLSFLARFHIAEWSGAYQTDNLRLAELTGIPKWQMATALIGAFLIGLACAYWSHLTIYYQIGQNLIEGGSVTADWRTGVAIREFTQTVAQVKAPMPTDWTRTGYAIFGAGVTMGLVILRRIFLRFPLHPIGYIIANAYGDVLPVWFPCFLTWTVKAVLMKLGGLPLLRRAVPFFLGLIIGHLFAAGVVWTSISVFVSDEVARRYYTVFG